LAQQKAQFATVAEGAQKGAVIINQWPLALHRAAIHFWLKAVSQWVWTEAIGLFVVFSQGKPHLALFITPK
jgi:hypothetical protein